MEEKIYKSKLFGWFHYFDILYFCKMAETKKLQTILPLFLCEHPISIPKRCGFVFFFVFLFLAPGCCVCCCHLGVSENSGFSPQIIHLVIGFSMIFTIHFGVFPLFLETPICPWRLSFSKVPRKSWAEFHGEAWGRCRRQPVGENHRPHRYLLMLQKSQSNHRFFSMFFGKPCKIMG